MGMTQRNRTQAWIWAICINIIVFAFAWVALARLPEPSANAARIAEEPEGPGGAFSQMTHHMGDSSVSETEPLPAEPVEGAQTEAPEEANEPEETEPGAIPLPVTNELPQGVNPSETVVSEEPEEWISEFYLDRGPALSFAPRLNPDGTVRPHPTDLDRVKAPTYEDQELNYSSENCDPPIMSPDYFSKLDLPDELRDLNFDLTVRIRLDARGRILGRPQIIRSSGSPLVDRLTLEKITNEAGFTPATRRDTGQPVPSTTIFPIWWRNPTPR
jgi:outer membrane biosynthesis protein TonB